MIQQQRVVKVHLDFNNLFLCRPGKAEGAELQRQALGGLEPLWWQLSEADS